VLDGAIPGTTLFTPSSVFFTATSGGSFTFGIGTHSADNIGTLLDDVKLDIGAVPEPATWALMIGGFGMAGGMLRRRRAAAAAA